MLQGKIQTIIEPCSAWLQGLPKHTTCLKTHFLPAGLKPHIVLWEEQQTPNPALLYHLLHILISHSLCAVIPTFSVLLHNSFCRLVISSFASPLLLCLQDKASSHPRSTPRYYLQNLATPACDLHFPCSPLDPTCHTRVGSTRGCYWLLLNTQWWRWSWMVPASPNQQAQRNYCSSQILD